MKNLALLAAGFALLSGCASFITGQHQPLSVETRLDGEIVEDVTCKLANDKGTWFVKTPGSTTVIRSVSNLNIACYKKGMPAGIASIESGIKAGAANNLLNAGTGMLVDTATGAAFDYPYQITVEMGESMNMPFAKAAGTPEPTGTSFSSK